MSYPDIADYGLIGNGATAALISREGSIDWLCLPWLDSPSVFAAVLDDRRGGRFSIRPDGEFDAVQRYVEGSNVLSTKFRTRCGEVELLDFLPKPCSGPDPGLQGLVLRRLRGIGGRVEMSLDCSPRFDYGRGTPHWSRQRDGWLARAGEEALRLFASQELHWEQERTSVCLHTGETIWIGLAHGEHGPLPDAAGMESLLGCTLQYWREWLAAQETGKYPQGGFWQPSLDRAALALKLLQNERTGAIAAAASCSLPTIIHGERNWDYRFSWIRDTSMTLNVLFELGHAREVELYFDWLREVLRCEAPDQLRILYRLREAVPPEQEQELPHLDGHKGSRPVRIGQYNGDQKQHDIYGELLELVFSMSRITGKINLDLWQDVRRIVDHVADIWRQKDHGIWELRTGPHHVTHSKLMCWVALDRGIKIAQHYGFPAPLERWTREMQALRQDILERGYSQQVESFTQHYDTEAIDASLLRIPLVGFLPVDDPRVRGTIAAVERELRHDAMILRYTAQDGLQGQEHGFLICLFWYLRCLLRQGRLEEVENHLRWMPRISNHLGLLGEQYDPRFQQITGNIPQAYSHIGHVQTILEWIECRRPATPTPRPSATDRIRLLLRPQTLNHGAEAPDSAPAEITDSETEPDAAIKEIANLLRAQYYDAHAQRVNYNLIGGSQAHDRLVAATAHLREFDPSQLKGDERKIAFWLNLFNTLVIHGVIAFGVRDSVKEVPFFFDRAQYRVGEFSYTLSDIEHGILRGNARPPWRLAPPFGAGDPRLAHCVENREPRIHFALVCASRSCPPIGVYEESRIESQLATAARVFINATTSFDSGKQELTVSQVFDWYRRDFRRSRVELIRYIADHLYEEGTRERVRNRAERLQLVYRPYDWRLNR